MSKLADNQEWFVAGIEAVKTAIKNEIRDNMDSIAEADELCELIDEIEVLVPDKL